MTYIHILYKIHNYYHYYYLIYYNFKGAHVSTKTVVVCIREYVTGERK